MKAKPAMMVTGSIPTPVPVNVMKHAVVTGSASSLKRAAMTATSKPVTAAMDCVALSVAATTGLMRERSVMMGTKLRPTRVPALV